MNTARDDWFASSRGWVHSLGSRMALKGVSVVWDDGPAKDEDGAALPGVGF